VILGIAMQPLWIVLGGITILLTLLFQMALGLRWIKLPRPRHTKVHRWAGYALIALGGAHGLMALAYLYSWSIL